ncbi:MAG: peptidoglycan-associated lipoprotein, partial [Burkholderiales bacterium]|nr:peptidoglycan-associated lipoprotein [Burkholderiales bacterium]
AEAVKQRLTLLGVADNQVEAVSFGEEKPRASGATEEAWSQNRRADIVYR